jgi:tRNA-specific 2-thiouridylase
MKKKVVVGMSGGVDSSVAAYLLQKEGYDVIGVTMRIWQEEDAELIGENGGCCGLSAVDDARRVAQLLGIPYYVLNFREVFDKTVINYFVNAYYEGKTPNPCIACNRYVKWEALLEKSLQIGADYIATGHYAHCLTHPETGRHALKVSLSTGKDQTYALYNLSQFQLAHTLMPLWRYKKDAVREIAAEIGLCVANKPDSQEICFVPDNDYGGFVQNYAGKKSLPGDFVDVNGDVIGRHRGLIHYTVGQRKGLGQTFGKPMFVKQINPAANTVTLAGNADLMSGGLYAENVNFMAFEPLSGELRVMAKIRYSHTPCPATIRPVGNRLQCVFDEPQRAVTPGQAVVFYKDSYIVCGGTIATD